MQAFRLSHAGVVLTDETTGESVYIDPGNHSDLAEISAALTVAPLVTAIVLTHEHADHWTPENLEAILRNNPECNIFTTQATAASLTELGYSRVTVVNDGDTVTSGSFELTFYGNKHALLHSDSAPVDNIGVNVNGSFLFGGDSLVRPPFLSPALLGVPIGSPWSNLTQVLSFIEEARAKSIYFTHDGMLSAAGIGLFQAKSRDIAAKQGTEIVTLPHVIANPGEWIKI